MFLCHLCPLNGSVVTVVLTTKRYFRCPVMFFVTELNILFSASSRSFYHSCHASRRSCCVSCVSVCVSVCLSVYICVEQIMNEIFRDFRTVVGSFRLAN